MPSGNARYCRRPGTDGVEAHCRLGCCIGGPHESGAPAAAAGLPCPVGSLDGVECDRARSDCRVAALAAGLPPARAGIPATPPCRANQAAAATGAGWPPVPDTRDSANADPLAQAGLAVAGVAWAAWAAAG
jgi:hypothetical protein